MATILIGADICPIGNNQPLFIEGHAQALFTDLLPEMRAADLVLANLETPLVAGETPILKTGPTFGVPPTCIKGIKNGGVTTLSLANNHIMDHGEAGLLSTLATCQAAGIDVVGVGKNREEARRILIKEVGNVRVGILSMAEREFSIAGSNKAGANPADVIDFVRNVKANRGSFDYLIVLLHGGHEFHVPSPRVKELAHFFAEMGAGAVIVQHPHCLGGLEEYRGAHLVYGQGALLMDEAIYRNLESFHEGFLVKLSISDNFNSTIEILPFVQSVREPGVRRMKGDREAEFQRMLAEKSEALKDDDKVLANWKDFCNQRKHGYMNSLLGHGRIVRRLNKRGALLKFLYSERQLIGVENLLRCETHREALETILAEGLV